MMLAPERMTKLQMFSLTQDAERVAAVMAREGSVHVVKHPLPKCRGKDFSDSEAAEARDSIVRLKTQADELLGWLDVTAMPVDGENRKSFLYKDKKTVIKTADDSLNKIQKNIEAFYRERDEIRSSLAHLDELSEQMHILSDYGLSIKKLKEFNHFYAVCGSIDRIHVDPLQKRLLDQPNVFATRPMHNGKLAFLLIADLDLEDEMDTILKDSGAQLAKLPSRLEMEDGTAFDHIEMELWRERDKLAELNHEFEKTRDKWQNELSEWQACLEAQIVLFNAMTYADSDGTFALLPGFVPVSRRPALMNRLEKEANGLYYAVSELVTDPAQEKPPTHFRNPGIFRPFELFVKTYGIPGYNDIDPTPLVAISFLLMFGMMFGDVGHGLILAGIGASIVFLPYRLFATMRDLGKILIMAGFSGVAFGFLFGSIFGIENDKILPALWMRPMHAGNLNIILGAAVILGVIMLSAGIMLNIVQAIRRRDIKQALIGQWSTATLIFFWGLIGLFGMHILGYEIQLAAPWIAGLLVIPLLLITGGQIIIYVLKQHRRPQKKVDAEEQQEMESDTEKTEEDSEEELAGILFEPIEIVMNLFTNSVSFLRVAAFGLAHAALTMAVFVINDMIQLPGADILTLPMEHLFIIVLEGMIVTIQCLRLEYYEFFSKFFVGEGVEYSPVIVE